MRYKVKWRAAEASALQPETFPTFDAAKERVRDLLATRGHQIAVEVWNEDETWQIVSSAGAEEWSKEI